MECPTGIPDMVLPNLPSAEVFWASRQVQKFCLHCITVRWPGTCFVLDPAPDPHKRVLQKLTESLLRSINLFFDTPQARAWIPFAQYFNSFCRGMLVWYLLSFRVWGILPYFFHAGECWSWRLLLICLEALAILLLKLFQYATNNKNIVGAGKKASKTVWRDLEILKRPVLQLILQDKVNLE